MQLREREREESMIRPLAIDHIVLRTNRYEELIDFYVDVLGCNIERKTAQEFGLTQLRAGKALIDIVDVKGKLGKKGGPAPTEMGNNVDHFCIQIGPIKENELIDYLKSRGVECEEFKDRYGATGMGRSLYIKDLAGNNIELRSIE
jgi:catechol 2,3-dioxygenase-like lactoylglutathione lyase family enzyme